MEFILRLERYTEANITKFAHKLAQCTNNLINSFVVYLVGDLGAGKTTLARGFIQWHGFDRVKSPTYTLVESYKSDLVHIHHFDCYRISDPEELEYIGIRDYSSTDNLILIEWPELASRSIPKSDLIISISGDGKHRDMSITPTSEPGESVLLCLDI